MSDITSWTTWTAGSTDEEPPELFAVSEGPIYVYKTTIDESRWAAVDEYSLNYINITGYTDTANFKTVLPPFPLLFFGMF